jgi:hypothetical protein
MALGAIAAAAAQQNQQYAYPYGYPAYAPRYRRARGCSAWAPTYDSWGGFAGYQLIRVRC